MKYTKGKTQVHKKKMFQEIKAKLNKEKNLALTEIQVTNLYKTSAEGIKKFH